MKKLNKKECRKFSSPGWKINPNHGLVRAKQVEYLVRTAVRLIGGQRVLILYIYSREQAEKGNLQPELVMFQNRTEYITLAALENGVTRWRTACFDRLKGDYDFSSKCAFYSAADEERVLRFCKSRGMDGFDCLTDLQEDLMQQSQREAIQEKEKKILQRMKAVKAFPRNLKSWIHREIMPQYVFYDYQKGKKLFPGYCTACKKEVQVSGAKHKQEGVCPQCHRKVTFKSRGKRGCMGDRSTLQIFQRISDNELVVRIVKIYYDYYRQDIPRAGFYENARIFVRWDSAGKVTEEHYYYSYSCGALTPWKKGDRPVFSRWQYNFQADNNGYLYHRNLDDVLKGTPWQYSQLKEYYLVEPEEFYALRYLYQYQRYPALEYLVKLYLYRLATAVAYGNYSDYAADAPLKLKGKNLQEVLGVDKSYLPLLQRVNPGTGQLRLIQSMIAKGFPLEERLFAWCSQNGVNREENITVPLEYMTAHKLMRYAEEQFARFRRTGWAGPGRYREMEYLLTEYRDYLCMAKKLKFDLHNSFVLYPANLPEAHDKATDLEKKEQKKVYNRKIRRQFSSLSKRFQFSRFGFMVVPPKSANEIIAEGHALHHCVGGYVSRVAEKQCIILFVRKEEEPEKPLCTLEVANGELMQARIYKNGDPSPQIQRFLDVWKAEVLQAPKLLRAA